jgi:hypothetical protein
MLACGASYKAAANHAAVGKATPATRGTATDSAVSASSRSAAKIRAPASNGAAAYRGTAQATTACFDESSATVLAAARARATAHS